MRYLSIYKAPERGAPTPEQMAKLGKLIEEQMKAGNLLDTQGCLPTSSGAKIRISGSNITVTDGPFTESKEVIGGFAILKANSKAEAIEIAKTFLRTMGEGECEVRELFEAGANMQAHVEDCDTASVS
jgi:hypothetical protein